MGKGRGGPRGGPAFSLSRREHPPFTEERTGRCPRLLGNEGLKPHEPPSRPSLPIAVCFCLQGAGRGPGSMLSPQPSFRGEMKRDSGKAAGTSATPTLPSGWWGSATPSLPLRVQLRGRPEGEATRRCAGLLPAGITGGNKGTWPGHPRSNLRPPGFFYLQGPAPVSGPVGGLASLETPRHPPPPPTGGSPSSSQKGRFKAPSGVLPPPCLCPQTHGCGVPPSTLMTGAPRKTAAPASGFR